MKRLFMVKEPSGKPVKKDKEILYFSDKFKAKEVRNKLSEESGFDETAIVEGRGYTVSKGPDHWTLEV